MTRSPILFLLLALAACDAATDTPTAPDATPTDAPDAGAEPADCSVPVLLDGGDCEQAGHFIDVARSCGAGDGYPAPTLSATCSADWVEIQSNGIPNFQFIQTTPNALQAQSYTWRIPRTPALDPTPDAIPLVGPAAVAVNGLPIFGPTEAPMMGSRDPFLDMLLDYCNGHTAPGGVYHFHARPECLFGDDDTEGLVLGYAFDGYPILAPYLCEDGACRELQSSYRQLEEVYGTTIDNAWDAHEYIQGLGDLDECNGATLADGSYAYFATDTFPYFLGCYRGVASGG